MSVRTFLDTGVLVAAVRGVGAEQRAALRLLDDPNRLFLSSPFLELELLPKALYHRNVAEVRFHQGYFAKAETYLDLDRILSLAREEAALIGVNAMDALHLAAACLLDADEFITTERPRKPIYRCRRLNISWLYR